MRLLILILAMAAGLAASGGPARQAKALAIDARAEPTSENFIGVRYRALLDEDELSETGWLLLFATSGFTRNGEYQPHFLDLMLKGSWASEAHDGQCSAGPPPLETRDTFTVELGLSDYDDLTPGMLLDNDIAARSRNPVQLPVRFANIDTANASAPDKIIAELSVNAVGLLEGREVVVTLERADIIRLTPGADYFRDPDNGCQPGSQKDISYRQWVATIEVPSLGVAAAVDFFINAEEGDKLRGSELLNFIWENPGRAVAESDRFRVIIFEPEAKTEAGQWVPIDRFVFDLRSPKSEYPTDGYGRITAGFRKVNYKGKPALEASMGYGLTDYVRDGDIEHYEPDPATMGVIDLSMPLYEYRSAIPGLAADGD